MAQSFNGLRVVTFESRRAGEMSALIERLGGTPFSAPSMQELPIPESPEALEFARRLLAGELDMVILLTGVGYQNLMKAIEPHHSRAQIVEALSHTRLVARGPKPVSAMREDRLTPDITAPEPNTYKEVITAIDADGSVEGKRIAIQEYGRPNEPLAEALRSRGADVFSVSVYAWALPEDIEPLKAGIQRLVDREAEVTTFTSARQIDHVLEIASDMGVDSQLRETLKETVIGSIGPTCSEALREAGLGFEFEPDRPKMGDLIRGLARSAEMLLHRKRSTHAAGVDTSRYRRVDIVWPDAEKSTESDKLHDSPFMRACRREPVPYTPIWLMRQAGRYQREYREVRQKASFLELCHTPELAAEVTLMAVDRLSVDAAIIFADILLIAEPLGVGLQFDEGRGPSIPRPIRTGSDVDSMQEVNPAESLSYVFDAVRMTRRALKPDVPLIGFCGAPFTVASYLIEGGSSRNFIETKKLMYRDPGLWHEMMRKLVTPSAAYLNGQIEAGAQAVQIFDSWVGCLSDADYRTFVMPHHQALIKAVKPGIPVLHFGTNSTVLLKSMAEAGGDVIGLDWRISLADGWATVGYDRGVQGNIDPCVLFATPAEIERQAKMILDEAAGRPGHIFNLGHGILPHTPIDHALALIDFVHEYCVQ